MKRRSTKWVLLLVGIALGLALWSAGALARPSASAASPGAGTTQVAPLVHLVPGTAGEASVSSLKESEASAMPFWLRFIERFFVYLTAGVVAFGVLHVELDLLRWAIGERKQERDRPSTDHNLKRGEEKLRRFDGHQRAQHFLLLSSFITLAITGLAQKYYTFGPSEAFINALGGLPNVRLIHRIVAGVMGFVAVYHVTYLWHTVVIRKNRSALRMIPTPKDIRDFTWQVSYYLGLRKERPLFDRFSYLQKFDYWAVFWGIFIMGVSGLVLLFPVVLSKGMGTPLVAAALTAHSDEAVLAVAWIFLVHLFYAHLAPAVFPFNTAIFTGKISRRLLSEEHPLEATRLERQDGHQLAQVPSAVESGAIVFRSAERKES